MGNTITRCDAVDAVSLPLAERLLDRLSDILLASDEILGMLATGPLFPGEAVRSIEEPVREIYDRINELMKRLAD